MGLQRVGHHLVTEQQLKAPNTSMQRNYYLSLYHLEKQKNSKIRKKVRTLKGGKMVQKGEPGEPEENFSFHIS